MTLCPDGRHEFMPRWDATGFDCVRCNVPTITLLEIAALQSIPDDWPLLVARAERDWYIRELES